MQRFRSRVVDWNLIVLLWKLVRLIDCLVLAIVLRVHQGFPDFAHLGARHSSLLEVIRLDLEVVQEAVHVVHVRPAHLEWFLVLLSWIAL